MCGGGGCVIGAGRSGFSHQKSRVNAQWKSITSLG